ncbi:MAG TPA: PAS domain-containing protein, partial [Bacteroidia bacterium]|nr:PAS domain-containing protein [Bacteroidia bacterium]
RVLVNEDGNAYRMVGTLQDVTERQNLFDRLKQNKELYKQAQALTHIGNWTWDIATNAITWSDELYRIYGLKPQSETVHFERFIELVHPDDRETVAAIVKNSVETGTSNDFYHRILLADGTEKILHAIGEVELDKNGRAVRMFGTGQDVTTQKKTEKDLQEKQTFIQKIADITPSIITAYNIFTGEYIFVNQAIESLLGYNPTDVLEKGIEFFLSIIHPDDLSPLIEKNARSLEIANQVGFHPGEEMIEEFEYRMLHKNGDYRWFHTYGTIFSRNKEGKVEVVLNISVDVTEQVASNLQLYQKHDELERSYKELESFSYIASHDLKEPLRKIRTFSDRLMEQEPLTDTGKDYLKRMVNSASHMQQLIDALLDYSRTNLKVRDFEKVDLNDLVEQLKLELLPQLEEKNAVITVHPLPIIRGVQLQLHQVFTNIISNALKYSRAGVPPQITISSTVESTKNIYPNSAFTHFHRITISDNGIGFEPRYSEQIFELFQRLHAKHEYSGTGIGLAICKKIILNHHGLIKATGVAGEGATFTIYLPVDGAVKS